MSKILEKYSNYPVSEVPAEKMTLLIKGLILDAAIDMDQNPDEIIFTRVTEYILKDFRWMKCIQIASAFRKGGLGQYGPGRLVPRTIYNWLIQARDESTMKPSGAAENIEVRRGFNDLEKYPLGQAIIKKIDWLSAGLIDLEQFDKISIKQIAGIIARKGFCNLEDLDLYAELDN